MKLSIFVLLSASLIGGAILIRTIWFTSGDDDLGPHIPEREVLDSVVVWNAVEGDVEFLLCPVFPDSQRSQFDQSELNRRLGVDRQYLRLFVINHSEQSIAHPALKIDEWTGSLSKNALRPIDQLLRGATELPAWLLHGIRSETGQMNAIIAPSSLSVVLMETKASTVLSRENVWHPATADKPKLVGGRLGVAELLTFLDRPKGRISEHVLRIEADERSGSR